MPAVGATRRAVAAGIAACLAARPLSTAAQPTAGKRHLGVLMVGVAESRDSREKVAALADTLAGLGWHDGTNLRVDWRWAANDPALFEQSAAALLASGAEILVTAGSISTHAARRQTMTIPIVFVHVTDPVGQGFVKNLAHPDGNLTGFSIYDPPMAGKWLELLMQVSPAVADAVVLFDPATTPYADLYMQVLRGIASTGALTVEAAPCRDDAEIDAAVARLAPRRAGLLVLPNTFSETHRDAIIAAAARYRLPAVYPNPTFAAAGGLMSYGVDLTDLFRRAAGYVDRILRGAKPGDLPVQQPTKFELAVNLKTAKEIGVSVAPPLLAAADEVIE